MARTTKSGKELSFNKTSKRWCKNYQDEYGKRKTAYFGTGTSVRDTRSYQEALTKYYPWKQERDAAQKRRQLEATEAAILKGKLPIADLGTSPYAQAVIADWKFRGMVTIEGYINLDVQDPDARDPDNDADWDDPDDTTWLADDPAEARRQKMRKEARQHADFIKRVTKPTAKPTRKRTKTISQHMDDWLAEERIKVGAGALTATGHDDKDKGIKTLREYVGSKTFGNSDAVNDLCLDFKQFLLQAMSDPTSKINSAHTVNDKTKFAGQFIEWCWKRGVIKEPPRTLDDLRKKLHVDKAGKPISVKDLQKLWDAAGDKMKCYMALGLNCGFKNGDITALTGNMVQGKRLVGVREKTKKLRIPMNYALWPLTQKLIKAHRQSQEAADLLFINTKGERITTGSFSALFKKVAKKAGVKATFEQLRDTSAELVRKQTLGEPGLLQIFLAHKDSSTAAYYTSNDPSQLKEPKLDKVVMGLEKTYGLKLDASPAKPIAKKTRTKAKTKSPESTKSPARPEQANLRKLNAP